MGAFLAAHRPPAHWSAEVRVLPNRDTGATSHEAVLAAVLAEIMTMWPTGTVLVIDYVTAGYLQALAHPPALLTEIGPAEDVDVPRAVEAGWINPRQVPPGHPDFESQATWIDNPVREWNYPIDTVPEIAGFLARTVRQVLGHDPGLGYTLHLWNDRDPGGGGDDGRDPDPEDGLEVEHKVLVWT